MVVAVESKAHHAAELAGEGVAYDRDDSRCAKRDERKSDTVVARYDHEVVGLVFYDVVYLGKIAGSLLHGTYIIEVVRKA